MKVLYLIDTLAIGGAEQSLLEILRQFLQTEPVMCHIYPGEALKPAYLAAGIRVVSLNVPGHYAFVRAVGQVLDVIRQEQPDLIHTTLFRADVVGRTAGRLARIPVVSSFINESYHPLRWASLSRLGRLKLQGVQLLDRLTARWVLHFMAVSQSTRAANCQALGLPPHRVSVIYRGRDPAPFDGATEDRVQKLRYELGLSSGAPVLLNVGRILARKGQQDLVAALPTVLERFPEAQLLIAGEGHDRQALEGTIQQHAVTGCVRLLGQRRDIATLLQLADVFVFPSHYEGHPGALVEAMLAARPIVASDIPVHREVIAEQETGLLVPLQSPRLLGEAIVQLLQDPVWAAQLGQQARSTALHKFDIRVVASQHEELYARLSRRDMQP